MTENDIYAECAELNKALVRWKSEHDRSYFWWAVTALAVLGYLVIKHL